MISLFMAQMTAILSRMHKSENNVTVIAKNYFTSVLFFGHELD